MTNTLTTNNIEEWIKNYKPKYISTSKLEDKNYGENLKYERFIELINYLRFVEPCSVAIQVLNEIITIPNFLESAEIKNWTIKNETLGSKSLILFLVDYEPDYYNSALEMLGLKDVFVELKPFVPLITFLDLFQILYWELQLNLSFNKRVFDSPGEYYYSQPSAIKPEERIKIILKDPERL